MLRNNPWADLQNERKEKKLTKEKESNTWLTLEEVVKILGVESNKVLPVLARSNFPRISFKSTTKGFVFQKSEILKVLSRRVTNKQ